MRTHLCVRVDGKEIFVDNLLLQDSKAGSSVTKMGGAAVFGLAIVVGPALQEVCQEILSIDRKTLNRQSFVQREADTSSTFSAPTFSSLSFKKRSYSQTEATAADGQNSNEYEHWQDGTFTSDRKVRDKNGNSRNNTDGRFSGNLVSTSNLGEHRAGAVVVRFLCDTVEHGYELLADRLRTLAPRLGGFEPYSDRLHHR